MSQKHTTLGVIIGNRDFFPDVLVGEARKDLVKLCEQLEIKPVMLTPQDTKLGGVETYADARKCADLFSKHRSEINGVLVCLPNFGDDRTLGEADRFQLSGAIRNCPFSHLDRIDRFSSQRLIVEEKLNRSTIRIRDHANRFTFLPAPVPVRK